MRSFTVSFVVYVLASLPAGVLAQATDTGPESAVLDEVYITGARLREASVQDTPVSVSVISAAEVEARQASDVRGLSALVPNLLVNSGGPAATVAVASIRGFNTSSNDPAVEPGVAVYVDGVYQVVTLGSLADVRDIERVEVLRGPQGALLGKSSGAGALLLTRTRPTGEFGGRVQVEYGSDNLRQVHGLLNFPILDGVLAGKLFGSYRERDDFVTNLAVPGGDLGGEEKGAARAALLFTPTESFNLYLTGDYLWDDSSQLGGRNISGPNDTVCRNFQICQPFPGPRHTTSAGHLESPRYHESNVTGDVDWDLGPVRLRAITGYRANKLDNNVDFDFVPGVFLELYDQVIDVRQFSQEVRLLSDLADGRQSDARLAWVLGAYYGDSTADNTQHQRTSGGQTHQAQRVVREASAVFGSVDFRVVGDLTLTVGGRHSWDEIRHDFALPVTGPTVNPPLNQTQSLEHEKTSLEGGLEYRLDDTKLIYVRYAEGFRAGGFIGLPATLAVALPYRPETSTNYEVGAKTEWLDERLLLNVTLFDTKFDDLQRRVTRANPNGTFTLVTTNAADARTKGVEVETKIKPVPDLTIRANLGYLDAQYSRYVNETATGPVDVSNRPFLYAPEFTGALVVDYAMRLPGGGLWFDSAVLSMAANWTDDFTSSERLDDPRFTQSAYATVDATITLDRSATLDYSLSLYVKNALDKRYGTYRSDTGGLTPYLIDDIGRTLGVNVGVRF